MKTLRSLLLWIGAGLLAACNIPTEYDAEGESFATQEFNGDLEPGEKSQGRQLHGMTSQMDVVRVSFSGAILGTQPLYNLRLEKGELVAELPLSTSGTTPSLSACPAATTGQARTCGFVSKGAGSCQPGTSVTLGGGACGTGTCTGDALMRVCSGTQPCEYGSATMLVSGDDACSTMCPEVSFTCPAAGTYNVLAGPYNTSQSWSITVEPSAGLMGWRTLRGAELQGARLQAFTSSNVNVPIYLNAIVSATTLDQSTGPYVSDSSTDTWLYKLQYASGMAGTMVDVCAPSSTAANTTPYAIPVSGLYTSTGARQESTTDFTFSCDSGVISKCYRWGYQPWRNGDTLASHNAHWACTRMARADYCGDGQPHTVDGTIIMPWDSLLPQVIAHPSSPIDPNLKFEAGWSTHGARCVSHWRWASLGAPSCQTLTPPITDTDGTILNRCKPGERVMPDGSPCANLCDDETEALQVFGSRMYNRSFENGAQ